MDSIDFHWNINVPTQQVVTKRRTRDENKRARIVWKLKITVSLFSTAAHPFRSEVSTIFAALDLYVHRIFFPSHDVWKLVDHFHRPIGEVDSRNVAIKNICSKISTKGTKIPIVSIVSKISRNEGWWGKAKGGARGARNRGKGETLGPRWTNMLFREKSFYEMSRY